jgi:hypothetical protein
MCKDFRQEPMTSLRIECEPDQIAAIRDELGQLPDLIHLRRAPVRFTMAITCLDL